MRYCAWRKCVSGIVQAPLPLFLEKSEQEGVISDGLYLRSAKEIARLIHFL
jgi:hypothetical protein